MRKESNQVTAFLLTNSCHSREGGNLYVPYHGTAGVSPGRATWIPAYARMTYKIYRQRHGEESRDIHHIAQLTSLRTSLYKKTRHCHQCDYGGQGERTNSFTNLFKLCEPVARKPRKLSTYLACPPKADEIASFHYDPRLW